MSGKRVQSKACWVICLCFAFAACGSDPKDPQPDGGAGHGGSSGSGPKAGSEANAGSDAPAGGNGAGTTGGDSGSGDGAGVDTEPNPDFEGLPTVSIQEGEAPSGCTQVDPGEPDTLILQLSASLNTIVLSAADGQLDVNGVSCTGVTSPKSVRIIGTSTADAVIVDFSLGAFPESLRGGTIAIDLDTGDADDTVAIAATRDADEVQLGTKEDATQLYFGSAWPSLAVTNQEILIVSTGPGKDTIDASGGSQTGSVVGVPVQLFAGADDDTLTGGTAADQLQGGDGEDVFRTAATLDGADVYNGGSGSDRIDYAMRSADLTISLCISNPITCAIGSCDCAADDGEATEHDTLVNIEDVAAGSGHDVIHGSSADNELNGNAGDDELYGEDGNDTSYGGPGNDRIYGGAGEDLLSGDQGHDACDGGDGQGDICDVSMNEDPINCELF